MIKQSSSLETDEIKAVKEVLSEIEDEKTLFSLLFVGKGYDLSKIEEGLSHYAKTPIFGCTTAGELGTQGFKDHSISGFSFSKHRTYIESITIEDLTNISAEKVREIREASERALETEHLLEDNAKSFAILLIDGLSVREEFVTGLISNSLRGIPLIGGSAGDGVDFKKTSLIVGGKFKEGCASIVIVTTAIPFSIIKSHHFEETEKKLVITESDPSKRIVSEIDGEVAAVAYADFLSLKPGDLGPAIYSKNPLMLKVQDDFYVRSIQQANSDGSLTFFCAIEDGLVLTLGKQKDLYENISASFEEAKEKVGEPVCTLFFECILRKIEVEGYEPEKQKAINDLYKENKVVGFHTYGEQCGSLHVNQTVAGVMFGRIK